MAKIDNQGIQDFYYQARTRGLARDFQFRVTTFKVNDGIIVGPADLVLLKTGSVPGKTISTVQAPFMGLDFQIPGTAKFEGNNGWPVKFYCTQDYNVRNTLEIAMYDTFNHRTSTGSMSPRDLEGNKIVMSLLDDQLNELRVYTLYGAFVTKLDEINFDTTKNGGVQEVGASIAYQYWDCQPSSNIAWGQTGNFVDAIDNFVGVEVGGALSRKIGGSVGALAGALGGGLASQATRKILGSIRNTLGLGGR